MSSAGDGALDRFLDELEAPAPSACGGSAAAVSAAIAAALVTMVARGSSGWADGPGTAGKARALRSRLTALGDADAAAFAHVIVVMRDRSGTSDQHDLAIGEALIEAADVPLRIAEAAAEVRELAAMAASGGARHLRPDAFAAAALAAAAVRAATHLVEVNLAAIRGEKHSRRAGELADAAAAAQERAFV